jgi:hypothetical protein
MQKPTFGQDFQVQGNSLPAYFELLRNGIHIGRFLGYYMDNTPAGRVSNCLKDISTGFHFMQVSTCKYKRKQILAQLFEIKSEDWGL